MANTFLGVALSAFGGIIQSFGFIAQKVGHNQVNQQNKTLEKMFQKSVLTKWIWWVGIMVYTVGGTLDSFALNFAPQSVISPLSAIKLATIAILSHFILKEALKLKDIIAIIVIIVGILLVVIFGPTSGNIDVTIHELRAYFQGIPYIVTVFILIGVTIVDYIAVKYMERKNAKSGDDKSITSGESFLLFSYVWIGCFFSSNNTLFIKSSVSIIASSVTSKQAAEENFTDYLTYIIFVLFVICLLSMEYFRQKALSHFGALYVVPIFSVTAIILTSVIGMVYFEEYKNLDVVSVIVYVLGIIITICGVLILSLDIAKLWSDLYDDIIKVAFVEYETCDYRYPQTVCYGGPSSEYFQNYFLKKPAVCKNPLQDDYPFTENAEPMKGKAPTVTDV